MISGLTVADLARDPHEVARALPAWRRGDADEAVMATLDLAARHMHDRAPVIWIWSGPTPDDCPSWILPIRATQAMAFGPRGPARVLMHALRAAVEAGVLAEAVSVLDWHGFVLLTLPNLDDEIAPLALTEACADADAVVLAPLPASLRPDGEDIPLVGPPPHLAWGRRPSCLRPCCPWCSCRAQLLRPALLLLRRCTCVVSRVAVSWNPLHRRRQT
jgi:hypothetical protein